MFVYFLTYSLHLFQHFSVGDTHKQQRTKHTNNAAGSYGGCFFVHVLHGGKLFESAEGFL